MRALVLCAALVLAAVLPAVDDAQVLAAARAASNTYQLRFDALAAALNADTEDVRLDTVRALGALRDPRAVPLLVPWLAQVTRSPAELIAVCTVLGNLGYESPVPQLRHLTGHKDTTVRQAAVLALHQIKAIAAGDWMLRAKENDEALRLNALVGLGQAAHAEAVEALLLGLEHSKPLIRQTACIGLGRLGNPAHGEKIKILLTDADPMVRRYAAEALAKLDYKPALPDLFMALEANVAGDYILRAVRAMTGQDFGFDPHAPLLHRHEAIERAFVWLAAQPK